VYAALCYTAEWIEYVTVTMHGDYIHLSEKPTGQHVLGPIVWTPLKS